MTARHRAIDFFRRRDRQHDKFQILGRRERVGSVMEVNYLVFNEGYAATAGDQWVRADLCIEAVRLGRVLSGLVPDDAEALGLVALMELQASRLRARTGPDGEAILLADQDRTQWELLIQQALQRPPSGREPEKSAGCVVVGCQRPWSPQPGLQIGREQSQATETGRGVTMTTSGPVASPSSPPGSGAAGLDPETIDRARILIIDDQRASVRLLGRLLLESGYRHIRSATDSGTALADYTEFQPDLILLDLHVPEIDGVMEQLRIVIPDGVYLPMLVVTADIEDGGRRRALSSGAHDFLVKPLDPNEVWLRVANLLRTRFLHLELAKRNLLLEDLVRDRTEQLEGARLEMIDTLDVANEAFVGMDGAGRITAWNRQAEVTFGWPREEAIGRSLAETIIPHHRGDYEAGLASSLAGDEASILNQRVELSAVDRGGRQFPIEMVVWPVAGDGGLRFQAFMHDITERRESEEATRAARDHALEASKLKSQFLANISHEIRTPMNGVLGMAHLLLDTELDDTQRRFLVVLRQSGQELMAIIDQILDFASVDAGRLELEQIDFELRAMVEGAVSLFAAPAHDKGLSFELDFDTGVPDWARGDPARLRQIITNLVGNAIKFTDSGRVDVRVTAATSGRVRFETVDTGIGIAPSAQRWLLEPFSQADGSATRRFGGTGLGLAMSNQLVESMGGVLAYHSKPGQGSTFWFEVPLTGNPALSVREVGVDIPAGLSPLVASS